MVKAVQIARPLDDFNSCVEKFVEKCGASALIASKTWSFVQFAQRWGD
jgi:hypothetical protein